MTLIRTVPDALERARLLVGPALEEAVMRLSAELRRPVEYHLGWADPAGNPTGGHSGKFVRPALAVLSAEAAGADPEVGIPGAVAVELLHNFSLLHDDVIDGDSERRHRPTVWAEFGVGTAVIAGDALLALAHQTLLEHRSPGAQAAVRCLAYATTSLIGGEADDMAFEQRGDVSVEECITMCTGKTGALLGCSASIGVALAGGPADLYEALTEYGTYMGLAFQAVDDVLGIWGDPSATGKPVGSDLRDRKKTLPIVYALESGGAAARQLRALLADGGLDDDRVARAAALVEECGGRARTEAQAAAWLADAVAALDGHAIPEATREELRRLAAFVVDREF